MLGFECSVGSGGGVGGAWAGEPAGSAVGDAEDWSNVGSAASLFWSWTSMAGMGLSMSSGGPGAGDGDGVGSSGWDGWSLYVFGDWFVADSGEACTCIVDGGAGEGIEGA